MSHRVFGGYTLQQYEDVYWLRFYGECTRALTKELHAYMNTSVMKRHSPYFWVNDLGIADVPSDSRKAWSSYLEAHRGYVAQFNLASPYVANSPIARGLLTAFHWVFSPPYPVTSSASLDDALSWITKRAPAGELLRPVPELVEGLLAATVEFDNRTDQNRTQVTD